MDDTTNTAVGSVMAVLAIAAVVARFYARYTKKSGYKSDDWLMLLALITMIGTDILGICAITSNPAGPERATNLTDTEDYTPADVLYTQLAWTTTLFYFTITSSTKLSILVMYNRIFSIERVFRRLVIILSVVVICFWIGCTVANLTNCVPMKYIWINSLSDPRYCFNYNYYWLSSGLVEAVLDVLILLLPVKAVMGLQFSRKQKVAVVSVFLLGGL
ncbi:hypothetical protein E8E14_000770 [Neopestalotiopsis sp. 37M]|nr:hypothetical protein E8E14_000770 [Neopestalotiopsis sp. 37M]